MRTTAEPRSVDDATRTVFATRGTAACDHGPAHRSPRLPGLWTSFRLHSIAGDGIGRAELRDRDRRTVKSTPDTGIRNISALCSDGAQNNSSDWLFPGNDVWCGPVEWLFIEDGVTMADKGKNPKKPAKSLKERRQEKRQKVAEAGEFIRKRKRS